MSDVVLWNHHSKAYDLHREIPNPTLNYPLRLYDLANVYIETDLSKNNLEIAVIRRDGWANVLLIFEKVKMPLSMLT
jgi:hypothetical protein